MAGPIAPMTRSFFGRRDDSPALLSSAQSSRLRDRRTVTPREGSFSPSAARGQSHEPAAFPRRSLSSAVSATSSHTPIAATPFSWIMFSLRTAAPATKNTPQFECPHTSLRSTDRIPLDNTMPEPLQQHQEIGRAFRVSNNKSRSRRNKKTSCKAPTFSTRARACPTQPSWRLQSRRCTALRHHRY